MMPEDPTLRTKWLMMLSAAFALATLFAAGTSACTPPPSDDRLPEVETAGAELPEYEVSEDELEDDETDLLGLYDPDR